MINKLMAGILALVIFLSCKKDNGKSFSPRGYWDGTLAGAHHISILNRDDGTSRLYFRITGSDTTNPEDKFEGTYTVKEGVYRAAFFFSATDTLFRFESTETAASYMRGLVVLYSSASTGTFEFIKQQ